MMKDFLKGLVFIILVVSVGFIAIPVVFFTGLMDRLRGRA